jgi:tetratricopeptide (TPR) repeat protein
MFAHIRAAARGIRALLLRAVGEMPVGGSVSKNPTLLWVLVTRRHLQRYESFLPRFEEAARTLAAHEREPRLASATIGRRQYERWLSGKLVGRPHPDACRILEHMFTCSIDELFGPADAPPTAPTAPDAATGPPGSPRVAVSAPALVDPDAGEPVVVAGGGPGDDTGRRIALRGIVGGVAAGLTAPVLEAIEGIRRSMDATLTDHGGPEMLDEWERRADDYTQAYLVTPPISLLRDALLDFADVQAALGDGQYGTQRARLWRVSARLAGMIGVFLYVLGQHRDARAWYHTGGRAAGLCGDDRLRAWMHARAASVSLHYGTPMSALELAERSASLHRGPSGTAVRTQLVRARAAARMGDRTTAQIALRQADAAFEQLDGREISDKAFGYTERQLLAHSANALTSLRDTAAAERRRAQALAAFADHGATEYLDPVLARIDESTCLLWEGDPTGAIRHLIEAISALPSGHRTGLIRVYAQTFANALSPDQRRSRVGAELDEFLGSVFAGAPVP